MKKPNKFLHILLRKILPIVIFGASIFFFSRASWLVGILLLVPAFLLLDENFSPK